MPLGSRSQLQQILSDYIEYRQYPYLDQYGNTRIGMGHELDARGISHSASIFLMNEDTKYYAGKLLYLFKFYEKLSQVRKTVLIALCYILGLNDLIKHTDLFVALDAEDYEKSATELEKIGYSRLARMMRNNAYLEQ